MASETPLPPISSPTLTLVHPTSSERLRIWTATHPQWGGALDLTTYLAREKHLLSGSFSSEDSQAQWMLTDGSLPPDQRPILSSCDTLKKASLIASKDGSLKEGISHGVASVFTFPEMRGRGYAGKMMTLLGEELQRQEDEREGAAVFSVLYSDIGKKFYNAVGWKPFESNHLEFSVSSADESTNPQVKPILDSDLPALASIDSALLHKKLSSPPSTKTRIAILPNLESLRWHLLREEFMCAHLFSTEPQVRGAIYTPPNAPNSRIWGVWTRNFYGGVDKPEKNVFNFLRFVVEDESVSDEVLAEAVEAIIGLARREAKEWKCWKIELWNPDERVKRAGELIDGVKYVEREADSITSLQWFGEGSVDAIEWRANEKYGWC